MRKLVVLIGSEPNRMTRLVRTYQSLKELGIDVKVMMPHRTPTGSPRIVTGFIRYLLMMVQVVFLKADVYHFYNIPDVIGLPLLMKKGILVYDVRSPWFSSVKESVGGGVLWRVAKVIEQLMTKHADYVLTSNSPLASRARKWGSRHVTVIPNYPPESFRPMRNRDEMMARLGLVHGPVVLYLGKISRLEGSELLRRIIYHVCRSSESITFLIVGDGPERAALERYVEAKGLRDRVLFAGWIRHSDVPDYINVADIGLLPRLWTTFSPYTSPENILKVNEYLAIGKPVIAPKMGGFSAATFPVIAVEPSDMSRAVMEYLRNPKPVLQSDRPTWRISHERLAKLYHEIGVLSTLS